MSTQDDKTISLIASLADDLTEVKVLPHPLRRIFPWILFAVAYISLAIATIGFRDDISHKLFESVYMFELLLVVGMSMSAAFCSSWLCCPDIRGQSWIVAIPLSLASVLALWLITKAGLDHYEFPILKYHVCYIGAVIFGLIPAFTIWFLSQRGKTTHPYLMGLMNVLSIGGLGYLALRIVCPAEEFGHIFVYHVMPYALFGVVITFVAAKIYRW
ncbi:MAG: NrsF family protein [Alcanivorax sp.]